MNEQPNTTQPSTPHTDPQGSQDEMHGECCEDCKRTCRRNFWTSILNTVIKISTLVLAALGIQSFNQTPDN